MNNIICCVHVLLQISIYSTMKVNVQLETAASHGRQRFCSSIHARLQQRRHYCKRASSESSKAFCRLHRSNNHCEVTGLGWVKWPVSTATLGLVAVVMAVKGHPVQQVTVAISCSGSLPKSQPKAPGGCSGKMAIHGWQ